MKVFVTGVCGQLGHDCVNELISRGHEVFGSDILDLSQDKYYKLDITNSQSVHEIISKIKPDAIIHCAGWTAVDLAEDEENHEKVDAINHLGTKYIAQAAKDIDAKMVYISTDYVFHGEGNTAWKPDYKNFAPLNFYGKTKLDGEFEVANTLTKFFIVRISWAFGVNGNNFIKTMIKISKNHDTVRVVNDQIGTPTYMFDLARLLVDMIETEKYGFYHATNDDGGNYISWYDFTKEIYSQAGISTKVIPVSTSEYGLSKAKRPFNSRLDKSKLIENGFKPLPNWKDALRRYLKELDII